MARTLGVPQGAWLSLLVGRDPVAEPRMPTPTAHTPRDRSGPGREHGVQATGDSGWARRGGRDWWTPGLLGAAGTKTWGL